MNSSIKHTRFHEDQNLKELKSWATIPLLQWVPLLRIDSLPLYILPYSFKSWKPAYLLTPKPSLLYRQRARILWAIHWVYFMNITFHLSSSSRWKYHCELCWEFWAVPRRQLKMFMHQQSHRLESIWAVNHTKKGLAAHLSSVYF